MNIKTILKSVFGIIFCYLLYLIPYTFLTMSFRMLAATMLLTIMIITIVYNVKRNKHKNLEMKDLNLVNVLNIISLSLIYTIFYILILNLIPNRIVYYNQMYYLKTYEYLSNPIYLILTSILIPFVETFFLRKLLIKFENKKVQIILLILNTFMIFFIQGYFIYGLFFSIMSLFLGIYTIKTKNVINTFFIQFCLNLFFDISLLYISTYKTPILIAYIVIFIITLIFNIIQIQKQRTN